MQRTIRDARHLLEDNAAGLNPHMWKELSDEVAAVEAEIRSRADQYVSGIYDRATTAGATVGQELTVDDQGNVQGMDDLVNNVLRNYPYLERQPDTTPFNASGIGGSPVNGRRKPNDAATPRSVLQKKLPALRHR